MKPAQRKLTGPGLGLAREMAERYAVGVKRFLLNRMKTGRQDVDDLAQEVHLRLLRTPQETLVRKPPAYIFTVAKSVLADFYDVKRRNAHVVCDSDTLDAAFARQTSADPAVECQLRQELTKALGALPPRQQAVLLLRFRDGLAYEEIAGRLDISVHGVHKHVSDAKARLRTLLWDRKGERG